ncbi:MAG: TIGR04076 family protein [Clostridia bacterium]|nr:TIGR04076 family protein [Clostridia bacterium]
MKRVKITVMKTANYADLQEEYENELEIPCSLKTGDSFIVEDLTCPVSFCGSAWATLFPFVKALLLGGEDFYDGWMKNKKSAMLSCNDGFRPVTFLLELL